MNKSKKELRSELEKDLKPFHVVDEEIDAILEEYIRKIDEIWKRENKFEN